MKQYLLKVWMTAALSLLVVGGVWGQTVTYSPSNGATDVSVSPVLSIEFDGEVTIGSGNIYVYSGDYSTYIEIPAQIKSPPPGPYSYSMNELLSVVGNTLFIDLTEGLLPNSTMLWVSIDASVISVDENEWDILDTWEPNFPEWSFTTVSAPTPLTATLSPADDATNVPVSTSTFEIRFSEDVKMADGVFFVSLFEKGVTPSKRNVELYSGLISNTIVSIDFDFQFLYGKEYEIVFPANAIKSVATGALFPGLSAGEWSFTTEAIGRALCRKLSPVDDTPNVPVSTATFEIRFSEDVEMADGTFYAELFEVGVIEVVDSERLYSTNISNNVVSLSFNHTLEYEKEYEIVFPANAIKSVATGALFPGLSAGEWSFTTEAAPFTLDLQEPEDGASNVALDASLVATFNQNIKLGTSAAVHIYDYQSELLVETITTGLSVSGSELTIDPTTDLTEGTHYYVVIPNGAVETTSGAPFAGLSDKDAWDFTTVYLPLENPVLSPAHNDDGVLKDVVLSLEFDKDIELGSGNIEIYSDGVEVRVLTKNSSSVSIVNNNTLQIDLSNNPLPEYETVYDVRIASTLIKRVGSDVYFVGFDAGEWSFTTEVQPDPVLMTTSSLSPADGDVEVSRAPTLQVSFDQEITWGPSGVLTIRRSDNDATAATISREQTGASISQDQLSIVFSSESLEYGTEYYVIIDEGFVKALNTSAVFPGLTDKTVWTFTTETAPPFWEEGYPNISNQTVTDFDFNAWADNSGVYYGVVTMSSTAPSVEQIEQGLNQGGTAARIAFNEVVNDNTNPSFTSVSFNSNTELGNTYFLHAVYKSNSRSEERRVG